MGNTHFLTRTLEKVKTEMSLQVLAYNMKRMINIFGVNPADAGDRGLTACARRREPPLLRNTPASEIMFSMASVDKDPFACPSATGRYLRKRDARIRPEST